MIADVLPGETAVFTLYPSDGWRITGTDAECAVLTTSQDGSSVQVTIPDVRYSGTVAVTAVYADRSIRYYANGGIPVEGASDGMEIPAGDKHLRVNTALGLFQRDGYTQIGWSLSADGIGEMISQGSRVSVGEGETLALYACWQPWTQEACFTWRQDGSGATITGYTGSDAVLCIPETLGGLPVMGIADGAFAGVVCETVILPETCRRIENGAFAGCTVETLLFFDTLQAVYDGAFAGCDVLRTIRIQAATSPVYSGTYYSTFADKMDRLLSMKDEKKIVLFSGSSTRFGSDSEAIDAAFTEYVVCNMGVFAYTNAVPQLLLIAQCMQEGDILIDSPELDAAKRQFCTTNQLDASFYKLIEADYDLLSRLDVRELTGVFSAYHEYQASRSGMSARSYTLSASDYDEDGTPVDTPSYNAYGDYILYRPDAEDDAPIYGLAVPYTRAAYPYAQYLEPYNAMCQRFLDMGVRMFFTWSPRNRLAVSAESTPEELEAFERYVTEGITIPVLLPQSEALVSGPYLYGTDNHLSTNGVALHTARVIAALQRVLTE